MTKVSFEFFPPKDIRASFRLWETARMLEPFGPRFASVTYGAGGSTRDLTHKTVQALHEHTSLTMAAHLTCVDASREETIEIAQSYAAAGVSEIVALRGDAPAGCDRFTPHPDGFTDSCDLIRGLKATGNLTIRVGAYPEPHPDADGPDADVEWLKRKFDAGADEALTQFFFDADTFLRFRDKCDKAGITQPITPGILPIENWQGVCRFAKGCGASIPTWLETAFSKAERDDRCELLALTHSVDMCSKLIREGVENLHFYTLNKADLTRKTCLALGLAPLKLLEKAA